MSAKTSHLGDLFTEAQLRSFLALHGVRFPETMVFLGARGRCAVYGLVGSNPAELWIDLAMGTGTSALHAQAAALRLTGLEPTLSTVGGGGTVPLEQFRLWSSVRPANSGIPASTWLVERPGDWPSIAAFLGRSINLLQELRLPRHGTTAELGQFVPQRGTWVEEWGARLVQLDEMIRALGMHLGPLTDDIGDRIVENLTSLAEVQHFTLVHGNLGPQSVDVDRGADGERTYRLTAWDNACAADPLCEAATLAGLGIDNLAPVLSSIEPAIVQQWLNPAHAARLDVYHLTWCLQQLCTLGAHITADGNADRWALVERWEAHVVEAMEPGFAMERLKRARGVPPIGPWIAPPVDIARAQLRIATATLGKAPCRPAHEAMWVAAGMSSARLAMHEAFDNGQADQLLLLATYATHDSRWSPHPDQEPVDDWRDWARRITDELTAEGLEQNIDSAPLVCWWQGIEAFAAQDDHVSDLIMRGLERLVRAANHLSALRRDKEFPPRAKLAYAVLGLGACHALTDMEFLEAEVAAELRNAYLASLHEAAQDLSPMAPAVFTSTWKLAPTDALPRKSDTYRGLLTPMVYEALAICQDREALPHGPRWILEHFDLAPMSKAEIAGIEPSRTLST